MGGGRGMERKEMYASTCLVHVVVQQKLTQHCKANILQ